MPSSWSPTQHTSPKNRHQRRLEARFPKTTQQSMWYSPSMRVACHTCQCGCIGSHLYASDASDFHSSFGFIPEFLCIAAWMFAPKSESKHDPKAGKYQPNEISVSCWDLSKFWEASLSASNPCGCAMLP